MRRGFRPNGQLGGGSVGFSRSINSIIERVNARKSPPNVQSDYASEFEEEWRVYEGIGCSRRDEKVAVGGRALNLNEGNGSGPQLEI